MPIINASFEIQASNHREYHVYYLAKHGDQWCRRLHLIGTVVGVSGAIVGLVRRDPVLAGGAAAAGIGLAVAGDVGLQHITPTEVRNPIYSVMSNFKMCYDMVKSKKL
ncbi:hypothetical protein STCU_02771 [Strigomonas culicis]|uniref:Transmembrane protein n=1 Tax=Strigomonas culicis TaxID=28005 RepID=S9UP71_9TRYP|nr:hypothetical protein STCU_02771 [Strigomonas culicis]|eukprot:EPY32667.1 hypothetical protein STCU_02771 [Strigomonas culicis]